MRHHLPADRDAGTPIQTQRLQVHPEMLLLESGVPGRAHVFPKAPATVTEENEGTETVRTLRPLLQASRSDSNPSAAAASCLLSESHPSTKDERAQKNKPVTAALAANQDSRACGRTLRRRQYADVAGLPGLVILSGLYLPPCNADLSPDT